MKALHKKGQVGGLSNFVMAIVSITIVLTIGFVVLTELRTTSANCSGTAPLYNETSNLCYSSTTNASLNVTTPTGTTSVTTVISKLTTIPNWIGIIIVVALAGIVLALFSLRR